MIMPIVYLLIIDKPHFYICDIETSSINPIILIFFNACAALINARTSTYFIRISKVVEK